MDIGGTWVHVGDGDMIDIDTHIDHFTGKNIVDTSDKQTAARLGWAVAMLLQELKRRVVEEGQAK